MQVELIFLIFVTVVASLFLFSALFWMHVMLFGTKTLGTITQTPKETGHDYVIEFTTRSGEKRSVRDGASLVAADEKVTK